MKYQQGKFVDQKSPPSTKYWIGALFAYENTIRNITVTRNCVSETKKASSDPDAEQLRDQTHQSL